MDRMDLSALSGIVGFTATSLMLTAAICLVAVFVAWYTVRTRIQLSQVILGVFSYVLVMILENIFSVLRAQMKLPEAGLVLGVYLTLTIVLSREFVRFFVMKFALVDRFHDTDAAIGFGLGFGGLYLLTCAFYYFSCYTTVQEFLKTGAEAFFANVGADAEETYALLKSLSGQTGWQYLMTAVDRVFFLVREIALSVLLWYGLTNDRMRRCLLLVPVLHIIAMAPDCMYNASVLENFYVKEILTYVFSGGIAFVAAKVYNQKEDQVAHFQVEKLRARRRK